MRILKLSSFILLLLLAACGTPAQTATLAPTTIQPTTAPAAETALPAPTEAPASTFLNRNIAPPGLPQDVSDLVSASGNCAACHTSLSDAQGNDISFDSLWRGTMMAQSARDPYWQASVSAEVSAHPELQAVIEDTCSNCHMPLAHFDAATNQQPTLMFGDGFNNPQNQLHDLAMDGVSCNSCHQFQPDNLGQPESFSGGYLIDALNRQWGERLAYGPLPVNEQGASVMQQGSGYLPEQADHLSGSEMCATCHTLYTPYLDSAGQIAGQFPEQVVYQEWQNSAFSGSSCQACHMPKVTGPVQIASVMGSAQEYLRQHTFTGANAFMLKLIAANAENLQITAEDTHMQAAILHVTDQLENRAATVSFGTVSLENGTLTANLTVQNSAGHKLPTAFPSRRAWLHVSVKDGSGTVIFESGAFQPDGSILGNDNDADPAAYEPHYTLIDSPEQVQIYEAILATTEGEVTTHLLHASSYLKDNRLLPSGFDLAAATADIAPYGAATEDENFLGGRDEITYAFDVSGHSGPFMIDVELLYQSIGFRWANNLRPFATAEAGAFIQIFDAADQTPIVLAVAQHSQYEQ